MSKVNYIWMGDSVVINYQHKTAIIRKGDVRFNLILKAIKENRLPDIPELMSPVDSLAKHGFTLVNGAVRIDGEVLPDALNKRLLDLIEAEMPTEILVRFWNNLKQNTSFNSRQMLYDFLQHNGHPLTDRGTFIAYRGISEDFKDKHTGKMDNRPGSTVEVSRSSVDDNPNNTCSHGLHVACFAYAKDFGQRLVEVEVNPKDVVAVPTDYNGTKMRVCKFIVLAECAALIEGPVYKPETVKIKEIKLATKQHMLRGPNGKFIKKEKKIG